MVEYLYIVYIYYNIYVNSFFKNDLTMAFDCAIIENVPKNQTLFGNIQNWQSRESINRLVFRSSGGTGRRTGLKILRDLNPVPVRFRSRAPIKFYTAGWSSLVARRAHNIKVMVRKYRKIKYRGVEQSGSSLGS